MAIVLDIAKSISLTGFKEVGDPGTNQRTQSWDCILPIASHYHTYLQQPEWRPLLGRASHS